MKKLLLITTALTSMLVWAPKPQADDGSLLLGGVINFAPVVVPGFSTWFPALNISQITYSNGNNTETCTGSSCNTTVVPTYGNRAHGSGKWYAELTIGSIGGSCCFVFGLVNVAFVPGVGDSIGGQGATIGYNPTNGAVAQGGLVYGTASTSTTGNTIGLALNLGTQEVWIIVCSGTVCGNWNNNPSANPATDVGGFNISSNFFSNYPPNNFPVYLGVSNGFQFGTPASRSTLNTGGTAFALGAPPSGFLAWH